MMLWAVTRWKAVTRSPNLTSRNLSLVADQIGNRTTAKWMQVSTNVKETISAATEEVKESFGIRNQQSASASSETGADAKGGEKVSNGEQTNQQPGSNERTETLFGKFKSRIPSSSASTAFHKLREAKFIDLAKQGYDIVKDELSSNPKKRKHLQREASSQKVERSSRTDVVFVPTMQSPWSKKWDAIKDKVRSNPIFKRIGVAADPVVTKSQEIAEDVRERWETSDSRIVHKIQDINETIFQETDTAATVKEIRSRDPTFSLPELVAEIQEVIKPVLTAYVKGDVETLKKYCTSEVVERCKAERTAYQSHGLFFDTKILHISDAEVRETKMLGASPIIIVAFQTQQVHCVRDRNGAITEGGQDTIHTVYYAWAMQQVDPEELGEDAIYPIWKLREMQQLGVKALI